MTGNFGQGKSGEQPSKGQGLNLFYFLAKSYAATILPFLRRGAGVEWPGLPGAAALVLLIFVVADTRSVWMQWYFFIWIAVLASRRLQSLLLRRGGAVIHSHYSGYPEISAMVFRCKDEARARLLEILLVMVIGVIFICTGVKDAQLVGGFVFSTSVALAVVGGIEAELLAVRTRRMNDAMIENRILQEHWRGGHRNN